MQTQSFTRLDVRALGARGVGGNIVASERGANVSLRKNIFRLPTKGYLPQPVEAVPAVEWGARVGHFRGVSASIELTSTKGTQSVESGTINSYRILKMNPDK